MKELLEDLYIIQRLSLREVGEIMGVSQTTIYRRLIKYSLPIHNSGELNKGKPSGALGKRWSLSDEAKENHRIALLGKPKSLQHRINNGLARRGLLKGENNPNWRGGITPINELIRKSTQYKQWRKAVFERDNYTCQGCGATGVYLHADHIKPFAFFAELRFDIDNGRTLCVDCHRKTPTWGRKAYIEAIV